MILIFGGTTEGRRAIETLDGAGKPFFYSTLTGHQKPESVNASLVAGAMDAEAMSRFITDRGIRLIIDAAHPFASRLHQTIATVATRLAIPTIRFERIYPPLPPDAFLCHDYADACRLMAANGVHRLLALTGVQTIGQLRPFWVTSDCFFRILDSDDSRRKALRAGFPLDRTISYNPDTETTHQLINRLHPDAIITKESGTSGGFDEKITAARQAGLPVYIVGRPALPPYTATVDGPLTLRRAVESLLPGFFDLRSGVTTGACATAAAKAALIYLLNPEAPKPAAVSFKIPSGETLTLDIESTTTAGNSATASVIKDAGDDPDSTNGCRISATVAFSSLPGITFRGGPGVGRVTLPGLGLPVGSPAINPAPRQMISDALSELYTSGLEVTISVEGGEEIARRTFNERVGVVGGISIIGTSGIIRPFSHEAYIEALRREIEVAAATDTPLVVMSSGARSERVVRRIYPTLPAHAFVHYGNAIGEALSIAADLKINAVAVNIMIGKAVKLAEGHDDTHSHRHIFNRDFILSVARTAGCSDEAITAISTINLARELWSIPALGNRFFQTLISLCRDTCRKFFPGDLTVNLLSDDESIIHSIQQGLDGSVAFAVHRPA